MYSTIYQSVIQDIVLVLFILDKLYLSLSHGIRLKGITLNVVCWFSWKKVVRKMKCMCNLY